MPCREGLIEHPELYQAHIENEARQSKSNGLTCDTAVES